MACRLFGERPLSEVMMNQFSDTYVRDTAAII